MIHYHGTPITPRSELFKLQGRHFCVSYEDPRDIEVCLKIGQSIMMDNGAFTAFTQGKPMDKDGFIAWCDKYLVAPNWAVIPDVIGGSEDQQRESLKTWPFPNYLSAPVWHLNLSIDYLLELADNYERICLGSAGEFWQLGTRKWEQRMDQAFEALSKRRHLPWIHGMRMLAQADKRWPLASADSTNIARNYKTAKVAPEEMAERIDAVQSPLRYIPDPQIPLYA